MRIDIDSYHEILDTLSRNKSRTFLTGFGVFWGVFMLVTLIGGGQGLKEMLANNFAGFATNSAIIWAQPTTKPYAGFRKGRSFLAERTGVVSAVNLLLRMVYEEGTGACGEHEQYPHPGEHGNKESTGSGRNGSK